MRTKVIYVFSFIMIFICGGISSYFFLNYIEEDEEIVSDEKTLVIEENSISESVKEVYNSVVLVQSYQGTKVISTGTGFVYKTDEEYGYILTNYHVIDDATSYEVVMTDNTVVETSFLGGDEYIDIAVLRVDKDSVLDVVEIGSSSEVEVGDTVFTIGSPLGIEYMGTVTKGILSGKDRMVSLAIDSYYDNWITKVMQADAAINPGNSGGPLLDIEGKVIGVNSLKLVQEEVEGMGFAIPIEDVMEFIEFFEKGEEIVRPYLGISMIDVSEEYLLYLSKIYLDEKIEEGVVIESIDEDSPAARAGLQKKDVIVKINDIDIENKLYLKYHLYKFNIGDEINVTYYRDGSIEETIVSLNELSE